VDKFILEPLTNFSSPDTSHVDRFIIEPLNVPQKDRFISQPLESIQTEEDDAGVLEAFGSEFGKGVLRGSMSVGAGLVGTVEYLVPGNQESWTRAKENIERASEDYAPTHKGWAGKAGSILGEALPYMGTAMVAAYGLGGVAGAAGAGLKATKAAQMLGAASIGFSVEGQNAYNDAIDSGATEDEANNERLLVGTINAAIEASQIGKLMKFHKMGGHTLKGFIRNVRNRAWSLVNGDIKNFTGLILKTALEEGLEEAAQEGVSIGIPYALRDEITRNEDGSVDWGSVIDRVGAAGIGGAFAGGVLGGAGALAGSVGEIGRPSDASIDESIEKINKMDIPAKEKEAWVSLLEEHRIEVREQSVEEALKDVDIPKNTVAIYKGKESGDFVFETAEGTEIETTEDGRTIHSETGEELELDAEISQPETLDYLKKDIPALKREWDDALISSVKEMDTSLREEHKAQIRTEKGKRISGAESILSDESIPIQTRYALAKKSMGGELGLRFDPLQFSEDQIEYFYQKLRISNVGFFDELNAEAGLNSLFGLYKDSKGKAKLPEPAQIMAMEKIWGEDFSKALFELRGESHKITHAVLETMNVPRALLASFDLSASGRQGILLLPMAPKQWAQSWYHQVRAVLSPEYTNFMDIQIKTDPLYPAFMRAEGHLSEIGSLTRGEEVFAGEVVSKIPGLRATERGYTTFLNTLRFNTFKKYYRTWNGTGRSDADYKMLAQFINHATGRGDLGGLEKFAPFLNAAMFAPRLQMGRIQSIYDIFRGIGKDIKQRQFNPIRKIIAADLAGFFGAGMGILWLLSHIKGVKVEKDPRSSDFAKVRFGSTRIDIFSGYSQIARLMAQMATGKSKGSESGDIREADKGSILTRFLQTKLSPAAGFAVDLARGETFLGEPMEMTLPGVTKQMYDRFTPLFFQDVADAMRFQGLTSAAIVAPLALHGIGAMTYTPTPASEAAQLRDGIAMEVMGKSWDKLSLYTQNLLKEARPEIIMAEKESQVSRKNFDMIAVNLKEQRRATDKIISKLPKEIRNQIKDLKVYIPGLSRRVGSGWYLNDTRYSAYQKMVGDSLSEYLPRLVDLPAWDKLEPAMKAALMEEVAEAVRKESIQNLMKTATMEDLIQLEG